MLEGMGGDKAVCVKHEVCGFFICCPLLVRHRGRCYVIFDHSYTLILCLSNWILQRMSTHLPSPTNKGPDTVPSTDGFPNHREDEAEDDSSVSDSGGLVPYSCDDDSSEEGEDQNAQSNTTSAPLHASASNGSNGSDSTGEDRGGHDENQANGSAAMENNESSATVIRMNSSQNGRKRFTAKRGILRNQTDLEESMPRQRKEGRSGKKRSRMQIHWANDLEQVRWVQAHPYPEGYFEACTHGNILQAQLSSILETDEEALQFAESFGLKREEIERCHSSRSDDISIRDLTIEFLLPTLSGSRINNTDSQSVELAEEETSLAEQPPKQKKRKRARSEQVTDDSIDDVVQFLEEAEQEYGSDGTANTDNSSSSTDSLPSETAGCMKTAMT
eukprot:gb/GECG01003321.1/.p1 GENE.gb/GECG01003321.1/~~gb/GECG01003321.1/.p1  ORF type:complete len:388 (+),score=74.83 gb/GECG01003321.1/:1-1164(+)